MAEGGVGDRMLVESERVGQAAREGVILEVLGKGVALHYRVQWQDGHESTFFPEAGSTTIVKMAGRPRPARTVKTRR